MDSPRKKSRLSKAGGKIAVVERTPRRIRGLQHGDFSPTVICHAFAWPEVLLPWVIAECVCQEVSVFLGIQMPRRYARWLTAKAEVCFQKHRYFRRRMRASGNVPRDQLRVYMRHWLSALLGTERRDLWFCLPQSFDLGHPLPPGQQPRQNRRTSGSLPHPRRWRPELVLKNRRWQWLAGCSAASAA